VIHVLWDASALAKRYIAEVGSDTVNALFAAVPQAQMVTTILGYSETFAALLRKHNQGLLPTAAFAAAQSALRNEIIDDPDFVVLGLEYDDILAGIDLIKRHNLNSADAGMLHVLIKHAALLRASGASVLVASDQRLLRAAKADGLEVLNPESMVATDVPAFLAAL
jgi:predicted nucleic acid-binding protein